MRIQTLIPAAAVLVLSFLPAAAEAGRLKGRLSGGGADGYVLVALSPNARASRSAVSGGTFQLDVGKRATLHLIESSGRYAGPVVLPKGKRAHFQLTGKGGNIGKVTIKNGFAVAGVKKAARYFSGKSSVQFDRAAGPRGAGKLGLVLMPALARIRAEADAGGDSDSDGIPDPIDIDDGDLVLDATDGDHESQTPPEIEAESRTTLRATLDTSLNAHFAALDEQLIDDSIRDGLILSFSVRNNSEGRVQVTGANVDCLGLAYCSVPGGSATLRTDALRDLEGTPWVDYDPDGDGRPNLAASEMMPETVPYYVGVRPHVTRSGLRAGDTVMFYVDTSAGQQLVPGVLPFYFVTVPALKEYVSGGETGVIQYPVAAGAPGTAHDHPIVLPDPRVTLTFWKPQRLAVAGAEEGSFIDMGHLRYAVIVSVSNGADGGSVFSCRNEDFSAPSETLQFSADPLGGLIDSADDAPVDPSGGQLSFTLDLRACVARHGYTDPGQKVYLSLGANSNAQDQTNQDIHFQLP